MKSRGFTLIETVVYLALFSILMMGLISSIFVLFESSDRNQTKAMLQEEKEYLLGKINWALSGMQTISSPGANMSETTLSLVKYDGTNVSVALSGTDMIFATGASPVALNNSNVKVSALTFIHTYATVNSPESVEAGFTISATTPTGSVVTQSASTTRYVRK